MRRGLLAVATVAGLLLATTGVAPVVAAAVAFGEPSAESVFTDATRSLTFTQPVTLAATPTRVEILLGLPDGLGPYVREVAPPSGTGAQRLAFAWDFVKDGWLVPNTPISASWRVTIGEGAEATTTVGPTVQVLVEDQRYQWRTKEGRYVRLHWYDGSEAFATRALAIGDEAVRKAATLFGVEWTEPVDFFVYADSAGLYGAMGPATPENVGGQAHADIRTMFAAISPGGVDDPWVAEVVPHELTHLVFATAVDNDYHQPPRWLNEGLATYLSVGYTPEWRATTEAAVRGGTLVPLHALVNQFPTTSQLFYQAYGISTSAVDYLVRTYGRDAMVKLVRSYADGVSDDEAFQAAIGVDTAAFEQAWLADIGASMPAEQGPAPAPPGPLPADWQGSPSPGQTSPPGERTSAPSAASASPAATSAPGEVSGGGGGDTVALLGAAVAAAAAAVVLAAWALRGRRGSAP
jgi:Peptidase MA superfamily